MRGCKLSPEILNTNAQYMFAWRLQALHVVVMKRTTVH
jgi:hypothetical protein